MTFIMVGGDVYYFTKKKKKVTDLWLCFIDPNLRTTDKKAPSLHEPGCVKT